MDPDDKDRITQNLVSLVENTELNPQLEQALIQRGVFNENMLQDLKISDGRSNKQQQLYKKVKTRGPQAYNNLVEALKESGNFRAARILDPANQVSSNGNPSLSENNATSKVWSEPLYSTAEVNRNIQPYSPPPVRGENEKPLVVSVRSAQQFVTSQVHAIYPMQSKPRGCALIIDNEEFTNPQLPSRKGSLVDANNLDLLLEQLGFSVTLRRNLSYIRMRDEIYNFSKRVEHQKAEMTVVCIMSHGQHGLIAGSDGREIDTEWMLRQFNNDLCPALKGKPKFFILQACRGDEVDYGTLPEITLTDGHEATDARVVDPGPAAAAAPPPSTGHKELSWEDMIIAYATLPGYVANRDTYRGTWFIESLVQIFMDMAADLDIKELLDLVANRLKEYESERGTKQTYSYEVRHFTKKLYFNPGLYK